VLYRKVIKSIFFELLIKYLQGMGRNREVAEVNLEGIIAMFDKLGESIEKKQKPGKVVEEEQLLVKEALKFSKGEDPAKFLAFLEQVKSELKPSLNTYFKVFEHLEQCELLEYRIRALLKNLATKKDNQWKDAFKADGPKKLSEIHDEGPEAAKQSLGDLGKSVQEALKAGPKYMLKDLEALLHQFRPSSVLETLLQKVCDAGREAIQDRKSLVLNLVVNRQLKPALVEAWHNKFKQLAELGADQPYLSSYLGYTIGVLLAERRLEAQELTLLFLEDEDEEREFYELVLAKAAAHCPDWASSIQALLDAAGCSSLDELAKAC
jgi:hypothetical protein